MYDRFATLIARHWLFVILGWAAIVFGANHFAPVWDEVTHDGDLAYMPDRMTSVRGRKLMDKAFPNNKAKSQIALLVERRDGPLRADDLALSDHLAAIFKLLAEPRGSSILGSDDVINNLIAENFRRLVRHPGGELDDSDRLVLQQLVEAWRPPGEAELPLVGVWSRREEVVGEKLVSDQNEYGQAALVLLLLRNEFMATANMNLLNSTETLLSRVEIAPEFEPGGLQLGVTGSAAIGADTLNAAKESISNIELTTVILVVGILIVVYRAPLLVFVTLTTMVVSVMVAVDLVALLTQFDLFGFKIFKTTKIFVIVILFGAGTDYCLFLISRYREELEKGFDKETAVAKALAGVGDALAGSALTTMVGLGMMAFAAFGKFRYSGPAIALCLAVALMACVTLTPALLRMFGTALFWPFGVEVKGQEATKPVHGKARKIAEGAIFGGIWGRISHAITARPGLILTCSLLVMLPFAIAGYEVDISYDLLGDLSSDRTSVQGAESLKRHYEPGDIGPTTVLVYQKDANFDSVEGRKKIARLSTDLAELPGVKQVRSLTQPTGDPPKRRGLTLRGLQKQTIKVHPRTKAIYLTQEPDMEGMVTRLDLVLTEDPFSKRSVALFNDIDQHLSELKEDPDSPWYGANFEFQGTTAGVRDLEAVTLGDSKLIRQLVVIAVLTVLIIILRSPLICFYLIASVVFSYLVTIGATELVFGWVYGDSFSGLDWKAPIFLFVILIAIGEDYNIYLTTRIFEEQEEHGLVEGLRQAVTKTGGIITSCGLIMAGSFMSMMTGTLRAMSELGFALSLGVLLDTFVVRPILVPCFLALLYRWRGVEDPYAEAASEDQRVPSTEGIPAPAAKAHTAQPQRAGS